MDTSANTIADMKRTLRYTLTSDTIENSYTLNINIDFVGFDITWVRLRSSDDVPLPTPAANSRGPSTNPFSFIEYVCIGVFFLHMQIELNNNDDYLSGFDEEVDYAGRQVASERHRTAERTRCTYPTSLIDWSIDK